MNDRYGHMLRFTAVGFLGFLIDSATLYSGLVIGLDLFSGRIISYFVAATITWYLHRRVTFRLESDPHFFEWLHFLTANALGGLVNVGGYAILILAADVFRRFPVFAVGIGALGGMVVNYFLSSAFVFRRHRVTRR